MGSAPRTAQKVSAGFVVLLVVASLLYVFMLSNGAAAPDLELIDQGVAAIYALIGIVLLWIVLGVLLVLGCAGGGMPGWAAIAALPVASAVGRGCGRSADHAVEWSDPAALADHRADCRCLPCSALYAFWARLPSCMGCDRRP